MTSEDIQQEPAAIIMATFALIPEQASVERTLDLKTETRAKTFQAATEALYIEFYGTYVDVHLFCEHMTERAEFSIWLKGSANIIGMNNEGGVSRNNFTEYGKLTAKEITTNVDTFSVK